MRDDDDRSYNDSVTDWLESPVDQHNAIQVGPGSDWNPDKPSTFPGEQPERIPGQLAFGGPGFYTEEQREMIRKDRICRAEQLAKSIRHNYTGD